MALLNDVTHENSCLQRQIHIACLYIHFSAAFFLKLYISCWSVLFQVIHIKVFFAVSFYGLFLIYSIQYETPRLTYSHEVYLPNERAHSCTDTKAGLQRFVTSVITLNIKQIHFSRRDLLLLHSFFSKLLKFLQMI